MNLKNKKLFGGYCGSLIVQDHAEEEIPHGLLIWNIEDNSVEEVNIENKWVFKTINVNRFTDYDDLDLEVDNPTEYMWLRVMWRAPAIDLNITNESKIKKYLKLKYNPLSIKFSRHQTTDENDFTITTGQIENINDKIVQTKIFGEYLIELGCGEKHINRVLKLDTLITDRLILKETHLLAWKIKKLWAENFKSYDNIELNFEDLHGITQIAGSNQNGKSTILAIITYLLYGETLETRKAQKYGDNRFINNKRDKDYCRAIGIIEINGEEYGLVRQTTRKWNRDRTEITSCGTTINFYGVHGGEIDYNNIFNEETKDKTQKLVEKSISNFDDFIRISLTTSANLNELLSINRSTFIDAVARDAGFDIFERKLEEFKDYRKEKLLVESKLVLDLTKTEELIKSLELKISDKNMLIAENINIKLPAINNRLENGLALKEQTIKTLHYIDPTISNLNPTQIDNEINNLNQTILLYKQKQDNLNSEISLLADSYDEQLLIECLAKRDANKDLVYFKNNQIKDCRTSIITTENDLNKASTQISYISVTGKRLKGEILDLENSKICVSCERELGQAQQEIIKEKIGEKKLEIMKLASEINALEASKGPLNNVIIELNKKISNIESELISNAEEMENLMAQISQLTLKKNETEKRNLLINELNNIPINIELTQLKLNNQIQLLATYNTLQDKIEENKITNTKIDSYNKILLEIQREKDSINSNISELTNEIKNLGLQIEEYRAKIKKYITQQEIEEIYTTYQKCLHRDGIPTTLLKKNINNINNIMYNLMETTNFVAFFNEDLELKMHDNNTPQAIQDAIGCSGKERTIIAIALKIALREINTKTKSDLFLLDEVTGMLVDESITEFILLLDKIKTRISKIFIIDHIININMDHIVSVSKNEEGISTLEII